MTITELFDRVKHVKDQGIPIEEDRDLTDEETQQLIAALVEYEVEELFS